MLMNSSVFKGFLGETRRGLAGFRSLMIGFITFFSDDIITEAFFGDMIGPNNVQMGVPIMLMWSPMDWSIAVSVL